MFLAIVLFLLGLYALVLACFCTFASGNVTDGDVHVVAIYWIAAIGLLGIGMHVFRNRKA